MAKYGCVIPHFTAPHRRKLLQFANYVNVSPLGAVADWTAGNMKYLSDPLGNDNFGCCTYADTFHAIALWTALASNVALGTAGECLAMYSRDTGFTPAIPDSDRGADPIVVCQNWQKKGMLVGGVAHKIDAYVQVNLQNRDHVKSAIDLTGHLRVCWNNFPTGWEHVTDWTTRNAFNPSGEGHDTGVFGYDDNGLILDSWGTIFHAEWDALDQFGDLGLCELSKDWIDVQGQSPAVFSWDQLMIDLKKVQD